MENKSQNKYEELLNELAASRQDILGYLSDVNSCKDAVLSTAKSTDYRSRYAKEDRIKTISSFYSTLLSLKQEYNRNIISEIELRRKLEKGDDGEIDIDIVKIAKQLESAKKAEKKANESKLLKPAQLLMEAAKKD